MKKGNMKLSVVLACTVLGLALTGCGGSETTTEQATTAVTEAVTEAESTTEATTEEVTEAATTAEATTEKAEVEKVEVENLPQFELNTTGIENGEWKQSTGKEVENKSPELTWDAVEGATQYAVIMQDKDAYNWLHWYVIVDKTHLEEGEFADRDAGYVGPYPPETHEYELYVVALAGEPENTTFKLDGTGKDINSKLTQLNTATDGTTGNVLAYGVVSAKFTPEE